MSQGILLVGHGTRDAAGQAEFLSVAAQLAALLPGTPVEPGFLELARPTIATAVQQLFERGASRLTVVPLLLFSAGHAQQDIPAAVQAATVGRAEVTIEQTEPLGCEAALVRLSALRYRETLAALPPLSDTETFLLLVGRGSHDAQAGAEMARFARLRWEETRTGWCLPCFAAMTEPTLAAGLQLAARSGLRRIVVQPHLLFQGQLAARITAEAQAFGQQNPHLELITVPHLGPHPLLVEALRGKAEGGRRKAEGGRRKNEA
ncbi:MAG: sirohydrochlorin chelatase [Pirellulales bacterium]